MKFKIGDIVRFKANGGTNFRPFMYDKDHVVVDVNNYEVTTMGLHWDYRDYGMIAPRLTTPLNRDVLDIITNESWRGSTLKFNFITKPKAEPCLGLPEWTTYRPLASPIPFAEDFEISEETGEVKFPSKNLLMDRIKSWLKQFIKITPCRLK
jgi:hypothetical protein